MTPSSPLNAKSQEVPPPIRTPPIFHVLSATSIGVALTLMNTSVIDVALPFIRKDFNATSGATSAVLLSYMIVNVILLLVFGRIGDMVGRKRIYIGGLIAFAIASALCAMSPGIWLLVASRSLMAIGAAAILANTTALIVDALSPRYAAEALGYNVLIASCAQVLGPLVGSFILTLVDWRYIFLANIPLAILGVFWSRVVLPDIRPQAREAFDIKGSILSFACLTILVMGVTQIGLSGQISTSIQIEAIAFFICLYYLVKTQKNIHHPLVDLSLFSDRSRTIAYLTGFVVSGVRFAIVLIISLYFQIYLQTSPLMASSRLVLIAVGLGAAAPVTGRLLRQDLDPNVLAALGLGVTIAGVVCLRITMMTDMTGMALCASLLIMGIGIGIFGTPNTSSILRNVPATRRGIANGIRTMTQNCGSTVCVSICLAILNMALPSTDKYLLYVPGGSKYHNNINGMLLKGFVHSIDFLLVLLALAACVTVNRFSYLRARNKGS